MENFKIKATLLHSPTHLVKFYYLMQTKQICWTIISNPFSPKTTALYLTSHLDFRKTLKRKLTISKFQKQLFSVFYQNWKLTLLPVLIDSHHFLQKYIYHNFISVVCYIPCICWSQNLPIEWKHSVITPKLKKGNPSLPSNYRPIALTCNACKILESIISTELNDYLLEHKLITRHQHGFLKRHSTSTNLLESSNDWTLSLSRHNSVIIASTDFQRAFDSLSHAK